MNIKGQGHSLTFVQDHSDSTFSNLFSLEKFHVEPPWDRGMKVNTNALCHMTKMATMADDLETWYAALVIQVLANVFK